MPQYIVWHVPGSIELGLGFRILILLGWGEIGVGGGGRGGRD